MNSAVVAMYCPNREAGAFKYTKALLEHVATPCVWATAARGVRAGQHEVASLLWVNDKPRKGYAAKAWLFARHVGNMRAFVGLCRRRKVRIAHIQTIEPFSLSVAFPFLRRAARRVVLSVHNVDPHGYETKKLGRLERYLAHRLYRKADLVFVFSREGREALVGLPGMSPADVVVLPMALHEALPQPPVAERRCGAEPRFLFFGRYRSNKGFEVLVAAFLKAREAGLPGTLVIRGEYPADREAMVRKRFRDAGCEGALDFANAYVDEGDIDGIFRGADVLVLPYTQFSSQSGVIFLGYAYRLPILASRVGGLTEAIEDDGTGILVEPGSADRLADGLLGIVRDYGAFARIDTAGLLRAKYSWETIGKATDAAYGKLLQAVE